MTDEGPLSPCLSFSDHNAFAQPGQRNGTAHRAAREKRLALGDLGLNGVSLVRFHRKVREILGIFQDSVGTVLKKVGEEIAGGMSRSELVGSFAASLTLVSGVLERGALRNRPLGPFWCAALRKANDLEG